MPKMIKRLLGTSRKSKYVVVAFVLLAVAIFSATSSYIGKSLYNFTSNFAPSFTHVNGGGTLIIAGGGNLPPAIECKFRELAGGNKARLVIIPSYHPTALEEQKILKEWKQFRAASVDVLYAKTRDEADTESFVSKIRNATGVWFTGGQQNVPASLYPGSATESELWNLLDRGGVIGGTSAGAAIMSRIMISEGKKEATICQGLDLMRGSVIDQHFMQRNRLTRLRGVLDQHPHAIGIGIDEGTALIVHVNSGQLSVIGKSYVMLWAPSEQASPQRAEFLKSGDTYCLDQLDWQNDATDYQM